MDSQKKPSAPYVRSGKATRRIRKERMATPTTGEDIPKASDREVVKLLIRDGIPPDLDGAACPSRRDSPLGPLGEERRRDRGPAPHRCLKKPAGAQCIRTLTTQ